MVTTGFDFCGYKIVDYKDILIAQTLVTHKLSTKKQADSWIGSKNDLIASLRNQATAIGADSIVGVSFNLITLSSDIMYLVATGTAVSTEKE